jgi:hypothetical protein
MIVIALDMMTFNCCMFCLFALLYTIKTAIRYIQSFLCIQVLSAFAVKSRKCKF